MPATLDVRQVNRAKAAQWRPPPAPGTYLDFARTLKLPDGKHQGHTYEPDSEPAQRLFVNEVDANRFRTFVVAWPSQRGKTLVAILLAWLYTLVRRRTSVGYVMPNLDKLSQNWEGKIRPAIVGTGYGALLPQKGPGSKGGRPTALTFRDPDTGLVLGLTYFMALGGGGKETSVSSVSPSTLVIDEADDAENVGQIQLALKRIESWGTDGRAFIASTVNDRKGRDSHPILDLAATGTRSRVHHVCPHCSASFPVEWEMVDCESARIVCPRCAVPWSDDDRRAALNAAFLRHENVDSLVFSLICNGLDFHMADIHQLVREWKEAKDAEGRFDYSQMRTFTHKVLCRAYVEPGQDESGQPLRIATSYLAARSSGSTYAMASDVHVDNGDSVHVAECPPEVEFLGVGCDVQRGGDRAPGRVYFRLRGYASDWRRWDLAWGSIACSMLGHQPTTAELHAGLERLHVKLAEIAEKYGRTLVRRAVDVGDRQDEIRLWLARHPEWWAVKGSGASLALTDPNDRAGWIYRRQQDGGWSLWLVAVDHVRRDVQAGYLVPPGKAGATHLPAGLDQTDTLIRHTCATAWITDDRGRERWSDGKQDRKYHHEWQARRDLLDCAGYADAAVYHYIHRPPKPKVRPAGRIGGFI